MTKDATIQEVTNRIKEVRKSGKPGRDKTNMVGVDSTTWEVIQPLDLIGGCKVVYLPSLDPLKTNPSDIVISTGIVPNL